jgi:hypothetical protein
MFIKLRVVEGGYALIQACDVMSLFVYRTRHHKTDEEVTRVEINYRVGKYQDIYVTDSVEEVVTKFENANQILEPFRPL